MRVYMNRPYEFYLNSSTGEIMRVILNDVSGTFTLLTTVLSFFTEAIVSVALIIAIFVIDAVMAAITTAVLLVELGLIYVVIKPVMRNASLKLMKANSSANKWILQGLNGIKANTRCAPKSSSAQRKISLWTGIFSTQDAVFLRKSAQRYSVMPPGLSSRL